MRRTLLLILAAALIAGCAPSEDQIAEAVLEALVTMTTQAPTITQASPSLVECRRLSRESLDLVAASENAVDDMERWVLDTDAITLSEWLAEAERLVWAVFRTSKALLNHASRSVASCSGVEDALLREWVRKLEDEIYDRAHAVRDELAICHREMEGWIDCPPIPSFEELLPEAR